MNVVMVVNIDVILILLRVAATRIYNPHKKKYSTMSDVFMLPLLHLSQIAADIMIQVKLGV